MSVVGCLAGEDANGIDFATASCMLQRVLDLLGMQYLPCERMTFSRHSPIVG